MGNVCLLYLVGGYEAEHQCTFGKIKVVFASAEKRSHLEIQLRELQRMLLEAQAQQIITDFLSETRNLLFLSGRGWAVVFFIAFSN